MRDFNSQLQEDLHTMRYAELRREADHYRLVKEALAGQPRHRGLFARLFARLLNGLGHSMSGWGSRLEARYGCPGELQAVPGSGDCP